MSALLPGATVALGFFDGCHLGHQQILKECLRQGGDKAAVFTFPNHPTTAIPGRQAPKLVTTSAERIGLLEDLGLKVFLKEFDREFSSWSAERFAEEILVGRIGAARVVVGHDYRFGHRAAGDVEMLRQLGHQLGFETTVIDPVFYRDKEPFVISSTRIRQAVAEGEIDLAARLMGRSFRASGTVVEGQKRGRTIGFPTANVTYPEQKVQPPYGVFATRIHLPDGSHRGVANFGLRPTVDEQRTQPLLEVHLFDFAGDLYGQTLQVEFVKFLRAERKFDDFAALKQQIEADAEAARGALQQV